MTVFLTSAGTKNVATAVTTEIATFDGGNWSRRGPSKDALSHVTCAQVAQEIYAKTPSSLVAPGGRANTLYFRYGDRPPPPLDYFLFHKQCYPTAEGAPSDAGDPYDISTTQPSVNIKSSPRRAQPPTRSVSPIRADMTLPAGSQLRNLRSNGKDEEIRHCGDENGGRSGYDSLLARCLLQPFSESCPPDFISVNALFVTVDGTVVDLVSTTRLPRATDIQAGVARQLRNIDDVMSFLSESEETVRACAAAAPRVPYHLCVDIDIRAGGSSAETHSITFLDVAWPPTSTSGSRCPRNHLRQQTRLLHRFLVSLATSDSLLTPPLKQHTADEQWWTILRSCYHSTVRLVGILHLEGSADSDALKSTPVDEEELDPFYLAKSIRRSAKVEALNAKRISSKLTDSACHVKHRRSPAGSGYRRSSRRSPAWSYLPTFQPAISPLRTSISQPKSPHQLPQLRCTPSVVSNQSLVSPCAARSVAKRKSSIVSPCSGRPMDSLRRIQDEEAQIRYTLEVMEQRARKMEGMLRTTRNSPGLKSADDSSKTHKEEAVQNAMTKWLSAPGYHTGAYPVAPLRISFSFPTTPLPSRTPSRGVSPVSQRTAHPRRARESTPTSSLRGSTRETRLPSLMSTSRSGGSFSRSHFTPCVGGHENVQARSAPLLGGSLGDEGFPSVSRHSVRSAPLDKSDSHRPLKRNSQTQQNSISELTQMLWAPSSTLRSGHTFRLLPLVQNINSKMQEQDSLMAMELMDRCKIEMKERNGRKAIEMAHHKRSQRRRSEPFPVIQEGDGLHQAGRLTLAMPRPSRVFFQ